MKSKAILQKRLSKKQFFLLMVAPFLIGLFIILNSMARADWDQADPTLISPKRQGWAQMTYPSYTSLPPLLQEEAPVTFAAR